MKDCIKLYQKNSKINHNTFKQYRKKKRKNEI